MRHLQNIDLPFTLNASYAVTAPQWLRIRDVLKGSDAVKLAGTEYLPQLSGQDDDEYKAYKKRAVFFNITSRILSTNSGVIVRRTPSIEYNDRLAYYFEDDRIDKVTFHELFRYSVREVISTGRVGILVDVMNDKPAIHKFPTESILNWEMNLDGSIKQILLMSTETTLDPITFEEVSVKVFYRLHLVNEVYSITKYDDTGTPKGTTQPSVHGRTLKYIPFTCITTFGLDLEPVKSPILEIVDLNLSHYLSSADLEHGRHFVGCPQPYITGGTSEVKLRVGSEVAWVVPNEKAKVGYLEFLGAGLSSLTDALKEKQSQISQFSAQLMDTSTRGSEAEGTVRMRYSSDAANLSDIALSVESGLGEVYNTIADWLNVDNPTIVLNKDFISTKMSYQELNALTKSLVDKAITPEIFMYNLERGEMLPPENQ